MQFDPHKINIVVGKDARKLVTHLAKCRGGLVRGMGTGTFEDQTIFSSEQAIRQTPDRLRTIIGVGIPAKPYTIQVIKPTITSSNPMVMFVFVCDFNDLELIDPAERRINIIVANPS